MIFFHGMYSTDNVYLEMQLNSHNSPLPPLSLRGGSPLYNVQQMPPLGSRGGWGSYLDQ